MDFSNDQKGQVDKKLLSQFIHLLKHFTFIETSFYVCYFL